MSFRVIQNKTHCIFSKKANIEIFDAWDSSLGIDENINIILPRLIEFTTNVKNNNLDGFVIEARKESKTIEELAFITNQVLTFINKNDPKQFVMTEYTIPGEGWLFYFNGINLHLLTFASCYTKNHPRNNYDLKHTYFLFQPDNSFERKRDTSGVIPEFQKELIRKKFIEAGMPYDIELAKSKYSALKFVKPEIIGGKLIRWWLQSIGK